MTFIKRFLNCFDARPQFVPEAQHPWAANAAPPADRVPATLERFASRFTAPNGEGVIDPTANRKALLEVAPYSTWKQIEADAHA